MAVRLAGGAEAVDNAWRPPLCKEVPVSGWNWLTLEACGQYSKE